MPRTEKPIVVARERGRGKWGVSANGYGAAFWDDENDLEKDSSDN
jgi:hypothetical protein